MVLLSYETPLVEDKNSANKEFLLPFNHEVELEVVEIFSFRNNNRNTYDLCSLKEPLSDVIPLGSHPMPSDTSTSKNKVLP